MRNFNKSSFQLLGQFCSMSSVLVVTDTGLRQVRLSDPDHIVENDQHFD